VCHAQQPSPFRAPNNVFRYTTEELLSITAQYANDKEAADPLPVSGGREVTLCSSKAVPSNVVIPDAMGDTKRRKWHPEWVAAGADYDDNNDKKVDDSNMECVMTADRPLQETPRGGLPKPHVPHQA
jgi:hypothetical protein